MSAAELDARIPTWTATPGLAWPWVGVAPAGPPQSAAASASLPRVSVVVPSFNQGLYLERTIRSVLLQGYPHLEVIVMDGGSTDDSAAIMRHYAPWLAHVQSERDGGQSDAIRSGFRRATGDILAYLNSDDMYLPGAIWTAVQRMRDTRVAMVYGDRAVVDAADRRVGTERYASFVRWQLRVTCSIPQETAFFDRHAYFGAGEVDASLHYAMDEDLWWRLSQQGQVAHIPRVLAAWRTHQESKSVQAMATASAWNEVAQREVRAVKARYLPTLPSPRAAKAIYTVFAARRRSLVAWRRMTGQYRGDLWA